jgi:hypothetical protein
LLAQLLSCAPATDGASASPGAESEWSSQGRIALKGLSISARDEERLWSLQAADMVYRNRRGAAGLVTYHDFAEVFATDARLSIELNAWDGFSSIPEAMASLLVLEEEAPLLQEEEEVEASEMDILESDPSDQKGIVRRPAVTRLLFETLVIKRVSAELGISFEADRGRYDIHAGTLVLEGNVTMRTSLGEEINAPRAVLSREHDGLYLPLGYDRGDKPDRQRRFVVLNDKGELSATTGGEPISYEDLIEKRERLVLNHYVDRAPPALRPILIAALLGMRVDQR